MYSTASRWWDRGALRETALLALTVLFGLQLLRVLFAELVFYIRDSLGAGSILPGVFVLALFLLAFLAAPIHKALGPRRALALTAGGLALMRLVEQLVPWPVADLALATAGTGLFFLCIPAYISHLRGSQGLEGGHTFAFGLLLGVGTDTAIKGVFATLDLSWNPGAVTYVVVVFLFACHWLLLRSVMKQGTAEPHGGSGFMESTPLIALGAVLFLQLLLFQNIGQQTALIEWDQPLVFIWIVMANAVGLVAAVGVLARPGFGVWPLAAALAGLFALLALGERSGVAAAMIALLGQVALSMSVAMIGVTLGSGVARRGIGGLAAASALGLLAFLVLTYLYYVNYQFDIPGGAPIVPLIGVALVLLCISGAIPVLREYRTAIPKWTPSVAVAFVLLLMPLGYLAVWSGPGAAPPSGFPVRVMSYNLHQGFDVNGYLAIEDLAGVIEDQKPDIVAVQEISRGWMIDGSFDMLVWLSRRLEMPYAWGPAGDSVWGNAIFSRYPISEARTQPMPNNDSLQMKRSFTTARIDLGGGESLTVIATHLHNPPAEGHLREPQVRALVSAWGRGQRTVLMGDLNASPHDPEILLLAEAGLRDAFVVSELQGSGPDSGQDASEESQESRGAGYTSTSRDPTRRIDYIWLSADLKASDFSVTDSLASDHFGVSVTLNR